MRNIAHRLGAVEAQLKPQRKTVLLFIVEQG